MGDGGLSWTVDAEVDSVRISVFGELDTTNSASLQAALLEMVEPGRNLLLDLDALRFIDSAGVRCLLVAREAASQQRGSVVVVKTSRLVERVLEVTGTLPLLCPDGKAPG